jgi:hypothetical protein
VNVDGGCGPVSGLVCVDLAQNPMFGPRSQGSGLLHAPASPSQYRFVLHRYLFFPQIQVQLLSPRSSQDEVFHTPSMPCLVAFAPPHSLLEFHRIRLQSPSLKHQGSRPVLVSQAVFAMILGIQEGTRDSRPPVLSFMLLNYWWLRSGHAL